jgi:SnoaL-like domain
MRDEQLRVLSMVRLWPIVARSHEVFNARDFDAYRELLHEDVELAMSGMVVRGLEPVTDFVKVTTDARPGLRIQVTAASTASRCTPPSGAAIALGSTGSR